MSKIRTIKDPIRYKKPNNRKLIFMKMMATIALISYLLTLCRPH